MCQGKLRKNLDKFKQYYDDELRYEEQRVWWEDISTESDNKLQGFRLQ